MIKRITADGFEIGEELLKYAGSQLRHIERMLPRKQRANALAEAKFGLKGKVKSCTISIKLPDNEIIVQESTQHYYASIDIASVAVQERLRTIKRRNGGGLLGRLRRTGGRQAKNSS